MEQIIEMIAEQIADKVADKVIEKMTANGIATATKQTAPSVPSVANLMGGEGMAAVLGALMGMGK